MPTRMRVFDTPVGRWHGRSRLKPHFAPQDLCARRERIRYSDTNFQLLIAAVEAGTGRTVHEVFDEFLYRPSDLRHSRHPEFSTQ